MTPKSPEINSRRPMFALSVDTRVIFDRLLKSNVGDVIGYEELTKLIGRDVQGKARSCLLSARKRAEREHRIVFGCVFKIGVKRLADTEIVDSGEAILKRARRGVQKGYQRLTNTVDFEKLPESHQVKMSTYASLFNAVATISLPKTMAKIEERVKQTHKALPLAQTLRAFIE